MKNESGFSLIELLVVIAIVSLLGSGVLLALNNARPRAKSRNFQRKADVETIVNAVYQYQVDNDGAFPASITSTPTEICKTGGSCSGLIDLSVLTTNAKYLVSMPFDPISSTTNGTGYAISKDTTTKRITAVALHPEIGEVITVTR